MTYLYILFCFFFVFFYSHSHGQNGLSSVDGASIIISFSSLDDLITYLYAFYASMKIDMSLQFDFLPINVRKSNKEQSSKAQLESCLDAYFKDQKLRQAMKAQGQVGCIDVTIESSKAKQKRKELVAPSTIKWSKETKEVKEVY